MTLLQRIKSWFSKPKPQPVRQVEPLRSQWTELTRIAGVPILYDRENHILKWTAGMAIDNDGSGGNAAGDKYHQSETSLKVKGKSLNALTTPFAVVPLSIPPLIRPFILGSHCVIEYRGKEIDAVVGDFGPRAKVGEASVKAAQMLGIPSSPVNGGISAKVVTYTIFCGQGALVNGVRYFSQPWRG